MSFVENAVFVVPVLAALFVARDLVIRYFRDKSEQRSLERQIHNDALSQLPELVARFEVFEKALKASIAECAALVGYSNAARKSAEQKLIDRGLHK